VFALELTLAAGDRNGRVAAALVFIADHARQIESDLCPVVCPGLPKSLLKEAFVLGGHFVCSHGHKFSALTGSVLDKYLKTVQKSKKGLERPWPEKIEQEGS